MTRYHWWNSPGFRDDDGSLQWGSVARHFRSRWHVAIMRLDNRYQDARARLAGACNADLWTGVPPLGYAGGYSHWRCGKARGHADEHRFNNYTWSGLLGDRTVFDPLPIRNADNTAFFDARVVTPFMKLADGRRAVTTRRRSRLQARWAEEARVRRMAERH